MDAYGISIFAVGLILYFIFKRPPFFLFISGAGLGIVIGAVWSTLIVYGMRP